MSPVLRIAAVLSVAHQEGDLAITAVGLGVGFGSPEMLFEEFIEESPTWTGPCVCGTILHASSAEGGVFHPLPTCPDFDRIGCPIEFLAFLRRTREIEEGCNAPGSTELN